jgi:hypothetical protein
VRQVSLIWKQACRNLKTTKNEACGALRADQRYEKTSQNWAMSGKTDGRTFGVQSLRQSGRMRK